MTATITIAPRAHLPTTRRSFMRAVPAIAAATAISSPVFARGSGDMEIIAAWNRWQHAFDRFDALPMDMEPEDEAPYWTEIDEAEETIRSLTARTPRGAAIQLWVMLTHHFTARAQHQAARRGDLDAVLAFEHDLDWSDRLMVAALKSLEAMGA